jgi:alkanesulfonate monooxygenase SsuD/methylene tetrahydromethanopterin reductase-like flavin-dependent oxidoreductase (luciferase family)
VIGAFGPAMTELSGRVGDGVNLSGGSPHLPALVELARDAHRAAGKDPAAFVVTASGALTPEWLRADSAYRRRLEDLGVDRLVLFARPQDVNSIRRAGELLRSSA